MRRDDPGDLRCSWLVQAAQSTSTSQFETRSGGTSQAVGPTHGQPAANVAGHHAYAPGIAAGRPPLLADLLRRLLLALESGATAAASSSAPLGLILTPVHVAGELRAAVGLPDVTAPLVTDIVRGSPAAHAGLQRGGLLLRAGLTTGPPSADTSDPGDASGVTLRSPTAPGRSPAPERWACRGKQPLERRTGVPPGGAARFHPQVHLRVMPPTPASPSLPANHRRELLRVMSNLVGALRSQDGGAVMSHTVTRAAGQPARRPTMPRAPKRWNLAARAGRWSSTHRRAAVTGWLVFVVAAAAIGLAVGTRSMSTPDHATGESGLAERMLARDFPQPAAESVLVHSPTATVSQPGFRAAVAAVVDRLGALGEVTGVRSPLGSAGQGLTSPDGHSALSASPGPGVPGPGGTHTTSTASRRPPSAGASVVVVVVVARGQLTPAPMSRRGQRS
jgi:hypothetical protein